MEPTNKKATFPPCCKRDILKRRTHISIPPVPLLQCCMFSHRKKHREVTHCVVLQALRFTGFLSGKTADDRVCPIHRQVGMQSSHANCSRRAGLQPGLLCGMARMVTACKTRSESVLTLCSLSSRQSLRCLRSSCTGTGRSERWGTRKSWDYCLKLP